MRALESDPVIAARKRSPTVGDRPSIWTRRAVIALSYIAQIAAIVLWGNWAHTHQLFRTRGLAWVALVIVGSILATIIHECGHAILAWCFEMGLVSFKAGPFQWVKRDGKWRFKFHLDGLLTAGGAVGAIPTDPEQSRWEEIVVIFAGPLANLLIGGPAIWAVMHDTWASYPQTWEFIVFTGSFCLIAAVLNLFPCIAADGTYSDGARILQILTRSHRTLPSIASNSLVEPRPRYLDVAANDQPILSVTRQAATIILPRVAAVAVDPHSRDLMDPLFNPLDRIFSPAPPAARIPIAAAAPERPTFIDVLAMPPAIVPSPAALPIAPTGVCLASEIESPPITAVHLSPEIKSVPTAAVCPLPEIELLPIEVASLAPSPEIALPAKDAVVSRRLASFTRIPASSIVALDTPFTRISLLPSIPALPSTGVPQSLKAPAVPSAFARRPVRPVPAPPSNLYAEPAVAANAALPGLTSTATPALALVTSAVTAPADPAAPALRPIAPPPPAAAPSAPRFDPLKSIRAAALENFPSQTRRNA